MRVTAGGNGEREGLMLGSRAAMISDRYVLTQAIREAVKGHETLGLAAPRIPSQDGALGAGRMRTMLHIERLCRLPQRELLRRRALSGSGR
jgi:hypothetical protein